MSNIPFNKLYESWQRYARGNPVGNQILLREAESNLVINLDPDDFLRLTTTADDLERIMRAPSITQPYDPIKAGSLSLAIELDDRGVAKVKEHEGRNRAWKALSAGIKKVPVQLLVLNRSAVISDIKGIEGQFSKTLVHAARFAEKSSGQPVTDPLAIGTEKQFSGYEFVPGVDSMSSLIGYVDGIYTKNPELRKAGLPAYVNDLNKYYTVKDDSGREYIFVYSRNLKVDQSTGEVYKGSLMGPNLEPHPLSLMSAPNTEELDKMGFKIIKK